MLVYFFYHVTECTLLLAQYVFNSINMNNIESAELSSMKMVVYTQNKRYNKIFFLLLFPVFCVTTSDLLFSIFFFSFTQVIENLCYPKNPGTSGMPISFFQWYCRILLDRYSSIESLASHIFFSLHFAYFA